MDSNLISKILHRPEAHARSASSQKGVILIVVLFILILTATGAFLATIPLRVDASAFDRNTQHALAEARRALIGRAAMDDDRPGSLPCPDTDNDGRADLWGRTGIHCPSYIGRLPWRTLGLPELRDASGEVLWYALSPSLRDHPTAQPINSVEPKAELSVVGGEPASDVAAVVIAPGGALAGQVRDGLAANDAGNYLEGHNRSTGDNIFETALLPSSGFNDRLTVITRDQLFDVVERRVANEIRNALTKYYSAFGFFPFANRYDDATFACTTGLTRGRIPNADLSPAYPLSTCGGHVDWQPALTPAIAPPHWFAANDWHLLTHYALAPACTRATLNCSGSGFLKVNDRAGFAALVAVSGRAIASLGQVRPCLGELDCIEQPLAPIGEYRAMPRAISFNDRIAVIAP